MMYLEMSRDEAHGGGTWSFPNCVWAPAEKESGGKWPFWTKVLDMRGGDLVIHLRGVTPNAKFVGYSRAVGDGFETTKHPPDPKAWSFSNSFLRADLEEFVLFHTPINLTDVFAARRRELEEYFDINKARGAEKINVFFVRQAGRLQCLNGAYLSDVDEKLFAALFGSLVPTDQAAAPASPVTVETGWQLATVKARLGQSAFANSIKQLYGNACCFPACPVTDTRFLVGSHIARWSDNEQLRGNLGNGLSLCLMHDRAFELGLFTLDENFRVFVNPRERSKQSALMSELEGQHGKQIRLASIRPLENALLEHWIRVDVSP
jgi:putative restriction endonuclease